MFRDAIDLGGTISAEHGLGALERDHAEDEHGSLAIGMMPLPDAGQLVEPPRRPAAARREVAILPPRLQPAPVLQPVEALQHRAAPDPVRTDGARPYQSSRERSP